MAKKEIATMPATHKKSCFRAEEIIKNLSISPHRCEYFKEDLVYYFYGRPAYNISSDVGARGDCMYFPVCFLIDISKIDIFKVFPFDSGAYKMFSKYFYHSQTVDEFQIKPATIDEIKHIVMKYWGNNDNYYRGKYNDHLNIDAETYIVQGYINLITEKGEVPFDERRSTIEIISNKALTLNADSLIAVFAPDDFIRRNQKLFSKLPSNLEIIVYYTFGGAPSSYNGVIREKVYEYLKNKSII